MKLSFLGAAHEVTGSCYLIEACGKKFLVDFGLEQGPDEYENQEIPVTPASIDWVLLTHAHIDHSGKLPLLYAHGFRGSVISTGATADLCDIMLRDSAHIQMFEAEWRNRKAKRAGREAFVPLYTMEDAQGIINCFSPCAYGETLSLCEGITARFTDVGHLLGSASIELWITENNVSKKLVFSGDIGNKNQPLIRDPQYLQEADFVVMESTYGDRSHELVPDYVKELTSVIQKTFDRGGNVVIPSFAVGRTQELLYFLRQVKAGGFLHGHDNFPVYVDSPLANEATTIFNDNRRDYFDQDALDLIEKGINPIQFPGLTVSLTSEDSKAINDDPAPKVILSASGMCEAGRIKHHLKHNLWRPESTILFVGYQAVGTLGRALIDGAAKVKLFGEEIEVRAAIEKLPGISGHADDNGLLEWISHFSPKPQKVFVTHGDDAVCEFFAARLRDKFHYDAFAPYNGAQVDLATEEILFEGNKERLSKLKPAVQKATSVFSRLVSAGHRLMEVIHRNEGGTNKDLAKFADQINSLCDKWDR